MIKQVKPQKKDMKKIQHNMYFLLYYRMIMNGLSKSHNNIIVKFEFFYFIYFVIYSLIT